MQVATIGGGQDSATKWQTPSSPRESRPSESKPSGQPTPVGDAGGQGASSQTDSTTSAHAPWRRSIVRPIASAEGTVRGSGAGGFARIAGSVSTLSGGGGFAVVVVPSVVPAQAAASATVTTTAGVLRPRRILASRTGVYLRRRDGGSGGHGVARRRYPSSVTFSDVLVIFAALGAFGSWLVAVGSVLAMTTHRLPGVSLFYLATHGLAFFDERFFTPQAEPHRVRLVRAFGVFFLFVFLGMVLGALSAR